MTDKTEAQAIVDLSQKPFVEQINGVPFLISPAGNGEWKNEAHLTLLPAPLRKKGTLQIHEVESYISMTKKHGSLGNSSIYIDVDYATSHVVATTVFNDHDESSAGWQDHKAVFKPKFSAEWNIWIKFNKQKLSQVDLAQFLETNISDIAQIDGSKMPSGSDILTFVSQLEEKRTVKYGSAVNLQNGMVQIEFIEEGDKGTSSKLELFKEFAIGIRPFFDGTPYQLKAFLRYRIERNTGEIIFWFELQRADRVLEDACKEVIANIKDKTGLPVTFGIAP
jgi:uncharacterized protein YfdQ (DUF2303 family)